MRITGGVWRSRRLHGPTKGMPLRPTPDALRERAFAVLGSRVVDARFLDLFAGTGSVGLEALSRAARHAVFVEHHRAAANIIRRNIRELEPADTATLVLCRPALAAVAELGRRGKTFDLIWADPPFEHWQEGLRALVAACDAGILAPTGAACLECPAQADPKGVEMPFIVHRALDGGASRLLIMEQASRHRPRAAGV